MNLSVCAVQQICKQLLGFFMIILMLFTVSAKKPEPLMHAISLSPYTE